MSSICFVSGWQASFRPISIQNQMLPWQKMERCRQHRLHRRSDARHQFLSRGRRRKMQILVSANNWNISSVENLRQKSHQCCPLSNPIRRGRQHCLLILFWSIFLAICRFATRKADYMCWRILPTIKHPSSYWKSRRHNAATCAARSKLSSSSSPFWEELIIFGWKSWFAPKYTSKGSTWNS